MTISIQKMSFRRGLLVVIAFVQLFFLGCCENHNLPLYRIKAFLEGTWSVEEELELEDLTSYEMAGTLGEWAKIPVVDEQQIDVSGTGFAHYSGKIDWDIDGDGYSESVRVLAVQDVSAGSAEHYFFAWEGDRYTLDPDRCYLGFTENDETKIVAAVCDSQVGAMFCYGAALGKGDPVCQSCSETWQCSSCSLQGTFEKCVPDQPRSGDVDIGVDLDIDIDVDIDF